VVERVKTGGVATAGGEWGAIGERGGDFEATSDNHLCLHDLS